MTRPEQAKDSLIANGFWSEVKIPGKIQYNEKNKFVCGYYDLNETFKSDPRIISLNDKIIFTDPNKTSIYNYYHKSWLWVQDWGFSHNTFVAVTRDKAVFLQNGSKLVKIYYSDIGIGAWKMFNYPDARSWSSVVAVGDKIIFFGGQKDDKSPSSIIDIYDNYNKRVTDHPIEARHGASVAVIGNKAIFFGGWPGYEHSCNVDFYDAESKVWTTFKINDTALKTIKDKFVVIVKESKAVFIAVDKNRKARMYTMEILDL